MSDLEQHGEQELKDLEHQQGGQSGGQQGGQSGGQEGGQSGGGMQQDEQRADQDVQELRKDI